MFSNDRNIETIAQLIEVLRHYIGLQSEYVRLDVIEKVVRLLTVITVALTIPTMIAGLFGMNVPVPGSEDPLMFWKITIVSIVAACALGGFFLRKR